MKTRLYQRDIEEIFLEGSYPDGFQDAHTEVMEKRHIGSFFGGKAEYRELYFQGIHIGYGTAALSRNTLIDFEADFETVEMHFALSGSSRTYSSDKLHEFEFGSNQHNIVYTNAFRGSSEWSASGTMQIFEVNLLPDFFKRYLPDEPGIFRLFEKNIRCQQNCSLRPYNYTVTPRMRWIIDEVMKCRYRGKFKRLFIEAKVTELLLLQLEQMSDEGRRAFCSLKKPDIEKIYAAREIILSNLSDSCTLSDLAKQVGTNECTLKKGFREVFGTTVFGYRNDLKMAQAHELLMERRLTVSEVSEWAGYKNPQHFTAAFKKKYGMAPCQLLRC